MARTLILIPGKVSNGLVIPDEALPFADGTPVEIDVPLTTHELQYAVETAGWSGAGADAWAMMTGGSAEAGESGDIP